MLLPDVSSKGATPQQQLNFLGAVKRVEFFVAISTCTAVAKPISYYTDYKFIIAGKFLIVINEDY